MELRCGNELAQKLLFNVLMSPMAIPSKPKLREAPTASIATRPLVMRAKNWGLNLFYTHDGNKNVSEVFYHALQNDIAAHYDYAPFGAVTRTSRATRVTNRDLLSENPFRFSSEYYDFTLDLVYYNHRHYNPGIGRWSGRDPLEEMLELNLYTFSQNDPLRLIDRLGLSSLPEPCPDDIKSRKIYKTSSRIMNVLIYRIYTYRSTTQARSVTTNGCSVPPMFAWLPLASLHMRIFNDACNKHDSCYGRCSSDKTQCDKLFFEDMKNACDQYDRDVGYRAQCKAMASAFYLAVVTRGESYYEDAQDTYCEHHQCSICYTGEENE